jgi:hypothetical protein
MAFVVLRRSRNTRSFYLVESYRDDEGRARKRTLCYLGREQDGTDTLAKALAHWEAVRQDTLRELTTVKGGRRKVLRRRHNAVEARVAVLRVHALQAEVERKKREQLADEAKQWQAFDRLRRDPTEQNAKEAKRAFLGLAMRHHPDRGGSHDAFLRLKDAYDRALAARRNLAVR